MKQNDNEITGILCTRITCLEMLQKLNYLYIRNIIRSQFVDLEYYYYVYFICQLCEIYRICFFFFFSLKFARRLIHIHIHIVLNSRVLYYYDMITKFLNQHLLFLESEETTPLSFGLCRGG